MLEFTYGFLFSRLEITPSRDTTYSILKRSYITLSYINQIGYKNSAKFKSFLNKTTNRELFTNEGILSLNISILYMSQYHRDTTFYI